MSAEFDRSQAPRFYFGNAARDLAHLLPPEENSESVEIFDSLDQSERLLWQIRHAQEKLSFLVADLKRIIR